MFLGLAPINVAFSQPLLTKNGSLVPSNADSLPTYRVYGPAGLVASGSLALQETGSITGATNASPIVITSANHGLTTGQRVTITGVGGNTNANGTWTITVIDANTFSLNGSTGNSAYTSGGTWNTTGVYSFAITPSTIGGYAQGTNYAVLVNYAISSTAYADLYYFAVI